MEKQSTSKNSKVLNLFSTQKAIYSLEFKENGGDFITVRHGNTLVYTGNESMISEVCDIMASRLEITLKQMLECGLSWLWIESSITDTLYSIHLRKNRVCFQQRFVFELDTFGDFDMTIETVIELFKDKFLEILNAGFKGYFDSVYYVLTVE